MGICDRCLHLEARDKDREGGGAVPRRLAMLTARRGQVRMERKRWELGRISWEARKSGENGPPQFKNGGLNWIELDMIHLVFLFVSMLCLFKNTSRVGLTNFGWRKHSDSPPCCQSGVPFADLKPRTHWRKCHKFIQVFIIYSYQLFVRKWDQRVSTDSWFCIAINGNMRFYHPNPVI